MLGSKFTRTLLTIGDGSLIQLRYYLGNRNFYYASDYPSVSFDSFESVEAL